MTLSEKILYLRKKAGLSQEELAELTGVSRQAISKWETGESTPEVDRILLICRAFGVTADWLLSDAGPEEATPPGPEAAGTGGGSANWVESLPGALGKLIRRYGWLAGVYVAVMGGLLTFFGLIVRAGGRGVMSFGRGTAVSGPFDGVGAIFMVVGILLIVAGVLLAQYLRKRSGGGKK